MKTAECVSPKHPDKMCDQISDSILDHLLIQDPFSRVAIETMGGHGKVYVTGEITAPLGIKTDEIKNIVHRITGGEEEVFVNIVKQSPEIANGVDTGGAGDQGIMVGYACRDNKAMIPNELYLARELCKYIYDRHQYDGKTQITIDDSGDINTIVASFQNVSRQVLREEVFEWLAGRRGGEIHCNPAGDWSQGGFEADTGLTGRKLAVDNYGPQIPIGGGAFSGKDATKVDRSGAYMARKLAVMILNLEPEASNVTVKLAYSIGIAEPVMATAHMEHIEDNIVIKYKDLDLLTEFEGEKMELRPGQIIKALKLREPQFEKTAQWGHFGEGFEWDK